MKTQLFSSTQEPEKSLISILKKHSGRDASGQISVRHQGGRQKRYYRDIDFGRTKRNMVGTVSGIEYDPNRHAHIAKIEYPDGEKRYILHPAGVVVGAQIVASDSAEITPGNALPLKAIPVGIEVHNIEVHPEQGGGMIRGAGTFGVVVAREEKYIQVKLPSGAIRRFSGKCWATIGRVGNITHKDEIIGKAGRKRLMGVRPTVRGTAQDPRSHPHGGGEGRSGEGMHPKTPWGKPARGVRTRKSSVWSNAFIISRRKK